ncbi:MAG: OmpA family protein [Boseongicola sp.]|nr:OmpA family protein [Boseongicola sp.]
MFGSPARIFSVILTAAALTGCGSPSEISRSATVLQLPQAESLSVVARQFQSDVPYTVYFGFDEDFLDAEAKARLDDQAVWIIENENVKFRVYGHADRVGSTEYNVDLGLRRATTAVAYLVGKGISEDRLEAMVSLGEDAPAIETENRERANRRVVTEVFGFVAPLPTGVARKGITSISVGDPVVPTSTPVPTDDPTPSDPTPTAPAPADSTPTGPTPSDPTPSDPTPSDPTPSDPTPSDPAPSDPTPSDDGKKGKNPNSGRGNGDEAGDPGNSGGRNNGGDEE